MQDACKDALLGSCSAPSYVAVISSCTKKMWATGQIETCIQVQSNKLVCLKCGEHRQAKLHTSYLGQTCHPVEQADVP